MGAIPKRQIRAVYDDKTIRVYQSYSSTIADPALSAGTFVSPPFNMARMTWIKPSFLWMMYRSGWGTKEGQERVLAIDITREGFEWALAHACLSHFDADVYSTHEEWLTRRDKSPVRIQWDPERDVSLNRLEYRSIQIGLSAEAVELYTKAWIQSIEDLSELSATLRSKVISSEDSLPNEYEYPLTEKFAKTIGATALP